MIVGRNGDARIGACIQSDLRKEALTILARLVDGLVEETLVGRT